LARPKHRRQDPDCGLKRRRRYICNAANGGKVPAAKKLCQHELMPGSDYTHDGPPPFLGTWKRIYVAILIYLAGVIFAFYLFTRAYR
jgi:hypothetical protein